MSTATGMYKKTLEQRKNACATVLPVQFIGSAFRNRILNYRLFDKNKHIDIPTFSATIKNRVISLLEEMLRVHIMVKVNMGLFAKYIMQTDGSQGNQETTDIKSFNTANKIIRGSTDLEDCFAAFVDLIMNQTLEFQEHCSSMSFFCL